MRTRIVKTASGKYALQVVSKRWDVLTVHKHIGTFSNNTEKTILYKKAQDFIERNTGQINLLKYASATSLQDVVVTQNKPLFGYELLSRCYDKIGLNAYQDLLMKDLIISRLYHPASKRELHEDIYESLGKHYSLKTIYRHVKQSLQSGIKETFQNALIVFARKDLGDSLQLVFYDVTTLYFESSVKTALKDFGFSKDHRPAETQIVIGLVVNSIGFPLYFDIFSGKTFEGYTFVTVVKNIQKLLDTKKLVVVADSAMLSKNNMDKLDKENIGFVVGARMANVPERLLDYISDKLHGIEGKTVFIKTYLGYHLLCEYSSKRAAKDRSDREKQIAKAETVIASPSKMLSRFKFVKAEGSTISLNKELIGKANKLEGVKGYLTNTDLAKKTIIDRYHDLWRIENSFRITKSDLEARPIFHRLEETIKAHMIIVFAGLAISIYIEQETGMSIKKVLKLCSKVLTNTITNTKTGETVEKETVIQDAQLRQLIERIRSVGH